MHDPVSKAATDADFYRARAAAEIAIAKAAGASKAYASSDNRTVFIVNRDGAKQTVRITRAKN